MSDLQVPEFNDEEILNFLKNPQMLNLIVREYQRYHANETKLLKFLHIVFVARHVVAIWVNISGSSRGGKDNAIRTVIKAFIGTGDTMVALRFSEHGLEYTGTPGQPVVLDGKIIYVSEEKGIRPALDTLRPLFEQKGEEFTVYSVGIKRKSQQMKVVGCPTLVISAVTPNFDSQTMKRLWLHGIDESETQTIRAQKLIKYIDSHPEEYERKTREMRLIEEAIKYYPKNVDVFIPYAEFIEFPSEKVRTRGDLKKFLAFIKCVTVTHIYQRYRIKKDDKITVISDKIDFNMSREILSEIFEASLSDIPNSVQVFYQTIRPVLESVGTRESENDPIIYPDGLRVKDIVRNTGKAGPTVIRYMNILNNAGKVAKSRSGRYVSYFPGARNTSNTMIQELVKVDWDLNQFTIQRRKEEFLGSKLPFIMLKPDGTEEPHN